MPGQVSTAERVFDLGLGAMLARLASGAISPTELAQVALARIHRLESSVCAFAHLDEERVMRDAALLETAGPDGRSLFGLPIAVKDTIDVAGWPAECGSRLFRGNVAGGNAEVVTRMERAGAVVVGKTATHELAFGTTTPPTRNPRAPDRIPGGSSGGSAAAVAAGMVPIAIGTDTTGSLRVPAALCGVCGLRPRPGLVATDGVLPLAPSLDVVGPLGRTAHEVGLAFGVMADGAPLSVAPLDRASIAVPLQADLGKLESAVSEAWEGAIECLAAAGMAIRRAHIPGLLQPRAVRAAVVLSEALETHRSHGWYPDRSEDYGGQVRFLLRYAEQLTSEEVDRSRRSAAASADSLKEALRRSDVVILPTTPVLAPLRDSAEVRAESDRDPLTPVLTSLTVPASFAGLAAASIPATGASPLPVGLQIVARDEPTALGVAASYEAVCGYTLPSRCG